MVTVLAEIKVGAFGRGADSDVRGVEVTEVAVEDGVTRRPSGGGRAGG